DALEALRATSRAPGADRSGRTEQLLALRYVEGLGPPAVWRRLGVGRSEYYREHARGLQAVASLLRERWLLGGAPAPPAPPPPLPAEALRGRGPRARGAAAPPRRGAPGHAPRATRGGQDPPGPGGRGGQRASLGRAVAALRRRRARRAARAGRRARAGA